MASPASPTARAALLATTLLALFAVGPALAQVPATQGNEFSIVAYLPEYRRAKNLAPVKDIVTDVIAFSVSINSDGTLYWHFPKEGLGQIREQVGPNVRILICLGGAGRSEGLEAITQSPHLREKFAKEVAKMAYKLKHLDGVDLDWELPNKDEYMVGYGELLMLIRKKMDAKAAKKKVKRKILTVALHAFHTFTNPKVVSDEGVDRVHLMLYDYPGIPHGSLETTQLMLSRLHLKLDNPEHNRRHIFGVPFYGRGERNEDNVKTYGELAQAAQKGGIKITEETNQIVGIHFDSPVMLREKVEWAKRMSMGGMMIWEIGQDDDDFTLTRALGDAAAGKQLTKQQRKAARKARLAAKKKTNDEL